MKLLRSASGLVFATMLSRLLGMVRDMLFASRVGGGTVMSAWILAFTIPNLLRRLLGEGALGTAVVPLFSGILEKDGGKLDAGRKFSLLFVTTGVFLSVMCVLTGLVSLLAVPFVSTERIKLTFQVLPLVMPYSVLVCLSALAGALLNSLKKFFLPALASLALNISLILCLVAIVPLVRACLPVLAMLSFSVLIAGALQLAAMLLLLRGSGLIAALPPGSLRKAWGDEFLREVWRLTLPGLVGASALQISFLADRWLACFLGDYAVPALYYSDRIVYLTTGVFAVALGSVLLPDMSRHFSKDDHKGLMDALALGLRQTFFISIPAAFFTFFHRREIIGILFGRGEFDASALNETAWALAFYAPGIPFFAAVKILLAGFHSRKDMKTPVKVSLGCISLNIILNLILMWPLRQGGIALATAISSSVNFAMLFVLLSRELPGLGFGIMLVNVFQSVASSAAALAGSVMVFHAASQLGISSLVALLMSAAVFSAVFLLASISLRSGELQQWLDFFKR
ncbi:MAG: murein biosynthesis integral membrane protein MurJ [Victivallales bacterium]|nr:murein biosynthesis integral membrane protein MurJ [Victivallales bacterium]